MTFWHRVQAFSVPDHPHLEGVSFPATELNEGATSRSILVEGSLDAGHKIASTPTARTTVGSFVETPSWYGPLGVVKPSNPRQRSRDTSRRLCFRSPARRVAGRAPANRGIPAVHVIEGTSKSGPTPLPHSGTPVYAWNAQCKARHPERDGDLRRAR
jgi:hypothetical protein